MVIKLPRSRESTPVAVTPPSTSQASPLEPLPPPHWGRDSGTTQGTTPSEGGSKGGDHDVYKHHRSTGANETKPPNPPTTTLSNIFLIGLVRWFSSGGGRPPPPTPRSARRETGSLGKRGKRGCEVLTKRGESFVSTCRPVPYCMVSPTCKYAPISWGGTLTPRVRASGACVYRSVVR